MITEAEGKAFSAHSAKFIFAFQSRDTVLLPAGEIRTKQLQNSFRRDKIGSEKILKLSLSIGRVHLLSPSATLNFQSTGIQRLSLLCWSIARIRKNPYSHAVCQLPARQDRGWSSARGLTWHWQTRNRMKKSSLISLKPKTDCWFRVRTRVTRIGSDVWKLWIQLLRIQLRWCGTRIQAAY